VGGTAIESKRGLRLFEVDLAGTQASGEPVILERVLAPESEGERRAESVEADESPAE
jgi:hypothetical protein